MRHGRDGCAGARPTRLRRSFVAAEWLGRTLGDWRRERSQKRDDEYIRQMEAGLDEGLRSALAWHDRGTSVPHKKAPCPRRLDGRLALGRHPARIDETRRV